jgi:hypothetical protein
VWCLVNHIKQKICDRIYVRVICGKCQTSASTHHSIKCRTGEEYKIKQAKLTLWTLMGITSENSTGVRLVLYIKHTFPHDNRMCVMRNCRFKQNNQPNMHLPIYNAIIWEFPANHEVLHAERTDAPPVKSVRGDSHYVQNQTLKSVHITISLEFLPNKWLNSLCERMIYEPAHVWTTSPVLLLHLLYPEVYAVLLLFPASRCHVSIMHWDETLCMIPMCKVTVWEM